MVNEDYQYEVMYGLSNRAISDHLEWTSKSFSYCKHFQMLFFVQLCSF